MPATDFIFYMTGATQKGQGQQSSSRSLGAYRSGSHVESLEHRLTNPIRGIVIVHVAGLNTEGTGKLTATATNKLTWAAPGEAAGAEITIANGEEKALPSVTANKFIRVKRTIADDLSGVCAVILAEAHHNPIAGDPALITDADDYKAIMVKNDNVVTLTGVKIWVDAASNLSFALDVVDDTDYMRDGSIRGELVTPGLTFLNPTSEGAAHSFNLNPAQIKGIWLKRAVPGSGVTLGKQQKIHLKHPDGASVELFGKHALGDVSLEGYELYRGEDAPVNFGVAWETFSALPHTTAALTVSKTTKLVTRYRNRWDLLGPNLKEFSVELDGGGAVVEPLPSAPTEQAIEAVPGRLFVVTALYDYAADGANQADGWAVWATAGSAPDPDVDVPLAVVASMEKADGIAPLRYVTAAYAAATDLHVVVRTERSADSKRSANTLAINAVAAETLTAPDPGCGGVASTSASDLTKIWTEDASNYIEVDKQRETIRFVIDGNVVAGMGRGRTFNTKDVWQETLWPSNIVMESSILFVAGSPNIIRIGAGNGTIHRIAEVDANGLFKVGSFIEDLAFPIKDFSGTAYYRYNTAEDSTDFSMDLIRAALRFEKYDQGGGTFGSKCYASRFRDGELG